MNTDSDGTVTITVDPGPMTYQSINIRGAQVSGNNITFDPNNLAQLDKIEISFQWFGGTIGDRDLAAPIKISGLTFQLAESAAEENDFTVESSANVTGKVDFSKKAMQQRFYYQAAWDLIYQRVGNDRPWLDYFGTDEEGNISYTTALVHALQYMDYRMADINLSEKGGDNSLKAEPVAAIMVEPTPVTLTPADMTIYMGGDGGYDAVVDENGNVVESANSLPHPIFQLTDAPDGVAFNNAVFTNADSGNTWKLVQETGASSYYHFENEGSTNVGVRVQYRDENGAVTSDKFEPKNDVYKEYTISVYKGDTKGIVTAVGSDGKNYLINTGTGKLTVRAVAKDDPTSDVKDAAPTEKVPAGTAMAVEPKNTTYTLNNTGVQLPDDSNPSLLFDDIITSDDEPRVEALESAVDTKLGGTNNIRHYEAKYLDLVDANNGNAWISSSAGTDIYWGYPATTDKNTNFTLVHFKDLHRDTSGNGTTGFDPDDIDSDNVDVLTAENGGIENTEYGIKFHVDKGGFSPFVLVWEAKPEPEPEPEPEPTPPPYIPPVDPDDTGVSDLLNTEDHIQYLFGYPEGTFGPENDMTRAEVAQMFYNLLLDQDVEITKTFDDVPEDAWYAKAVNTLASLGVVSGVGDNKFEPNRSITRAEFTTMAMKFAVGGEEGENIFSDVDKDDWFYKAVVDSIQYGWIHGYPDGTFRPNNPITRAEVTAIVNNMLGREADEDFVDEHAEELTQFSDIEKHWAYYHIAEATNDHDYTQPSSGENWTRLN